MFSGDGEHCTNSESEAGPATSLVANASVERMTSSPEVVVGGEVAHSTPICTSRLIRSARSKLPPTYMDYDFDSSFMAQQGSMLPGDPLCYEDAVSGPDSEQWKAALKSEYDSCGCHHSFSKWNVR